MEVEGEGEEGEHEANEPLECFDNDEHPLDAVDED
jgi:hypothetical protein